MGFLADLHRETRGVHLAHGAQTFADLVGQPPTAAGITVSEATAEALPVVFSCVRVIASAVAMLPLKLYRRHDDGTTGEATDHPLYAVLHDLANPEMTAYELRALLQTHLLLWGDCYAELERNARGEVVAAWPLQPWRMRVDRDSRARLRFTYTQANGTQKDWLYDPHRPPILRLHVHSLDGVTGRSVVRVLRESLGLTAQLQRFGAKFFRDGMHVNGVLEVAEDLEPEQEQGIRETLAKFHTNTDRAHQTLVLSAGRKYTPIGMPLEDAQFLESRKFQRSELCGAFGVPPHMVGDLERATFSNIEAESLRWLRDGLDPHLVNWESALRRDCLGPRSFDRYYARFVRNAMVRGDLRSRSEALQIQRRNGVISADEWRAFEELDPIGSAKGGDDYLVIGGGTAAVPAANAPGAAQE